MDEVQLGSHTIRSHGFTVARTHMHDWLILVLLVVIWVVILIIHPFYRFVGKDMMDDLRYPLKCNTVPVWAVPVNSVCLIFCITALSLKFCLSHSLFPAPQYLDVCGSVAHADFYLCVHS